MQKTSSYKIWTENSPGISNYEFEVINHIISLTPKPPRGQLVNQTEYRSLVRMYIHSFITRRKTLMRLGMLSSLML